MYSGCSSWLDINEDPNNPTEVPLNQILPTVQVDIAGSVGMSTGGLCNYASMYMHQTVQRGTANNDYGFTGSNFGVTTPWRIVYERALTDIREIINIGEADEAWHYVGVAQILKGYIFSVMVDIYGDVPYFEANMGGEQPFPAYDDGETVYQEVLQLLDSGIYNIARESTLTPLNDDLFYGGGEDALDQWRKFANTLKLKMYNLARLVWDVSSEVNALLSNQDDLINGPEDDFEFQLLSLVPE